MTEKVEGTTQTCKACGQLTVCRKIIYEGHEKLQWQDEGEHIAHYSFDFLTKEVACKHTPTKKGEPEVKGIDFKKMLDEKNLEPTYEQFMEVAKLLLGKSEKEFTDYVDIVQRDTKIAIATRAIQWATINKAMDAIGIKHPSRMAFIRAVQE